ncbi:MAG: DUF6282 family protein [Acidobacteriota bacterium]|nr:DUF6282 family protein [Acidobacteriota bacterium]
MPRRFSRRSLVCYGPLALLLRAPLRAQTPLTGVIDIHAHSDPDSVPRSIDAIDLARLAKARGMRALVLKNHFEPTAALAYIVRKEVPGIEILGGIVLNRTVGGVNPAAVEHMVQVKGGWGRVVWMPTFDAGGPLPIPELKQVAALAAKHHLTLETGHAPAAQGLVILREARLAGVERMVVTHGMLSPIGMSIPQMKEASSLGAYIEFVFNGVYGKGKQFEMGDYARVIHAVGPAHCILSSDMGQAGNPLPPDGLLLFFEGLRNAGISQTHIDMMSKTNPARVLGL